METNSKNTIHIPITKSDDEKTFWVDGGVTPQIPRRPTLSNIHTGGNLWKIKQTKLDKKVGNYTSNANTPRAPSSLDRIEDTMCRDNAAPSFLGPGLR